jgi:hypothetical protein
LSETGKNLPPKTTNCVEMWENFSCIKGFPKKNWHLFPQKNREFESKYSLHFLGKIFNKINVKKPCEPIDGFIM